MLPLGDLLQDARDQVAAAIERWHRRGFLNMGMSVIGLACSMGAADDGRAALAQFFLWLSFVEMLMGWTAAGEWRSKRSDPPC